MKALKEKRISLRSLWRRGLVILSLFALVFASCASSEDDASSGKRVRSATMTSLPTQYLGRPVDLTGVVATVYYYGDNEPTTIKYDDNPSKFAAYPPIVSGAYDSAGNFYPMGAVRVAVGDGDAVGSQVMPVKVVGILRDNTTIQDLDPWATLPGATLPTGNPVRAYFSQGLHVVVPGGLDNRVQKEAFADDYKLSLKYNKFDFGGLALQADYEDGSVFPLSFDDVDWYVKPDYDPAMKVVEADGSYYYKGYVFITVGKDELGWLSDPLSQTTLPAGPIALGVTVQSPLDKVKTVYDKDGTGISKGAADDGLAWTTPLPDSVTQFFFWEDNTVAGWETRLSGEGITVRYRGTSETRTFKISDLLQQRQIWYNANPGATTTDFYVTPFQKYPWTKAAAKAPPTGNGTPVFEIYYRGERLRTDFDIFTKLTGLALGGQDVDYHLDAATSGGRDNDIEVDGIEGESGLAKKLDVKATYQTYYSTTTATLDLNNGGWKASTYTGTMLVPMSGAPYDGPYYYTTYAQVRPSVKDGKSKAVRIVHRVESLAVEAKLGLTANQIFGAVVDQQKQGNQSVLWKSL